MDTSTLPLVERVSRLLDGPELARLVSELGATRWTGRPGYPIRAMVGTCLVKSLYGLPTWTRTVRLVAEHEGLAAVLGAVPSADACYRFTRKLRDHRAVLDACIASVLASLHAELPGMGEVVAIDGSDLPAYANGQRHVGPKSGPERRTYSDPDASWGHRTSVGTRNGGSFYGYKIHAAVCTTTDLPLAWRVESARDAEIHQVPPLLDSLPVRPLHAVLDKGYDGAKVYEACEARGIRPVVPLRTVLTDGRNKPPRCAHGWWTFGGSDVKRGASKWRCPTGKCTPASTWVKASRLQTLVPRSTKRWGDLYRKRGAVEREFGRLKHEWAMLPLRVRRIERVRLHVDLTVLTRLAVALDRARAAPKSACA